MDTEKKNKEVEEWWHKNPFSFGVGAPKHDQVGTIPFEYINITHFETIERRFRKHSNGAAQDRDSPVLSTLIDYEWPRGKKALEIAIGSGFAVVEMVKQGVAITGIDLTDFAVDWTKKNLSLRGMHAEVLKMDAQAMTFPDNTFDFVYAWGTYMHMPHTEEAIAETYRVLKLGGRVMTYMYNRDSWAFWFNTILVKGILFGGLIKYRGDIVKLTSRYADGSTKGGNPLTKFYLKKHTKKMFKDAGFVDVTSVPFRVPNEADNWPLRRLPIFKYILPPFLKRHLGYFSYGQIVTGEKRS